MKTRVYLELAERSKTALYCLPVACWEVPAGFNLPSKGEKVTLMVLKPQAKVEYLEPREFEVVSRSMYLHCDLGCEVRSLKLNEITLVLKDLGSAMVDSDGYGALGEFDPVIRA